MTLHPLTVQCPTCGSADVTYTCEPHCCFTHVCGSCDTSFELCTQPLEGVIGALDKPSQERDSLAPTVACARCESLEVYAVEREGSLPQQLVCARCHTRLELVFTSVDPR